MISVTLAVEGIVIDVFYINIPSSEAGGIRKQLDREFYIQDSPDEEEEDDL